MNIFKLLNEIFKFDKGSKEKESSKQSLIEFGNEVKIRWNRKRVQKKMAKN